MAPPTATPIPPTATLVPLRRPTNLRVEAHDNGVTLNWDAANDDVDGYEIMRRRRFLGENEQTTFVANTDTSATTCTDTSATTAGERYIYRVIAIRGDEKSERSDYARVDH